MFGWLKKKKKENVVPTVSAQGSSDPMSSLALGLNPLIAASIQVDPNAKPKPLSKAKKPRKPKVKKQKVEPRVDVLKFDFDPQNPRLGSIELDWNKEFIELLIKSGYTGNTEDEIVDKWFNDICKMIAYNQYPGTAVSTSSMVNRKNIGEGKVEIS